MLDSAAHEYSVSLYLIFFFSVSQSLALVGLTAGDSIMVSGENHPLIALSMGSLHHIDDDTVTVLCDRY